jgi:NAD(P) transhydrogenase subunit beta
VILALLAGGAAGWLVAVRVNMIQIPAMVAFQHGAGGIAAMLTSFVELTRGSGNLSAVGEFSGLLGIVIGAATFSGSMVAGAKLAGLVRQTPVVLRSHNGILAAMMAGICMLGALSLLSGGSMPYIGLPAITLLSIALGAVFAMRIGGADMPVLISFLNATAGLAASFCGVIIQNRLLIACGATVAASGSILTHVMCQAMNRRLLNVLVAADPGKTNVTPPISQVAIESPAPAVAVVSVPSDDRSLLLRAVDAAREAATIIIIPGYGMALAHAQFEVGKLAERFKAMGKSVKFAIHPIAGRMPGHMHVLLAEADVDSDILFDLPEINGEFRGTDLALIVGACDVVNPAAIHIEGTPISGMPILAAHEAKQVIVCNLDSKPGYSGVENPLYADHKTLLLLGDAKATVSQLLEALS